MASLIKNIGIESVPPSFLQSYLFAPYRQYRMFTESEMQVLQQEALRHRELSALYSQDRLLALLAFESLAWDTELLGYACGRIKTLTRLADSNSEDIENLLACHLQAVIGTYQSIDLELDCSDSVSVLAAQKLGFRILDTKLTYLYTCEGPFRRAGRPRFRVAEYEGKNREALLALGQQTFPQIPGRFRADPELRNGEPERLYLAWLEGALAPESGYQIQLAWRDRDLVGFLCFKASTQVHEHTGHHLYGRGLSGVLPSAMGAYVDLLCHSIEENYRPGDGAEFETSVTNPQAFRVFEHLGFHLVRSTYVLKHFS